MFTAEDCLTVYCENMNCDERLPLEGVPSYCRGVYLKGCFDLSKFQFGNEVEYVFLGDTMDVSGCLDFDKMMPNFNGAGNLKCVDWELSSDEYEDVTKVPIWNASRLSGLDQLIDLRIWGGFLIANIDEISRCKSLRNVYISLNFDVAENEVDDEQEDQDEACGTTVACEVDDSSFDEFIKRDFSTVDWLDVKIILKNQRTWDISALGKKRLGLKVLAIDAKNCWVTGMESFRQSKDLSLFSITMKIGCH